MNYIFFRGNLLERAGGPSTYLYNLRNGLEKKKNADIKFIYNEQIKTDKKKKRISLYKKIIAENFPGIYVKIMINHIEKNNFQQRLKKEKDIELVHFHDVVDLVKSIKYIPNETIKVLMSHSPESPSIEFKKNLIEKSKKRKYNFDKAEKVYYDKYVKVAFEEADVLVFPSIEAMEPYYATCPNFEELIKGKTIKYIMTGTEPLKYKKTKKEFREENYIPEDAFVICFIGRHNEVKGYDNFIEIAKKVLEKEEKIYILTAGTGNIETPKSERWIDIGWTDDPGSVVNASDLFILPNRQTYFDLVLLEVLSIGKTTLVSNTGGNKAIERLSRGVIKYDNIEDAIKKVLELYLIRDNLKELEEENGKVYNNYFTVDKFTENYINMLKEIRREKGIE